MSAPSPPQAPPPNTPPAQAPPPSAPPPSAPPPTPSSSPPAQAPPTSGPPPSGPPPPAPPPPPPPKPPSGPPPPPTAGPTQVASTPQPAPTPVPVPDRNTQIMQIAGGLIIGVSLVSLIYKYMFADNDSNQVEVKTIDVIKIPDVQPESDAEEKKAVKKPPDSEWPCAPRIQVEPCPDVRRRFSLDGSSCFWKYWAGYFKKEC